MVPDRQKVPTDGQRQKYITPTLSGDNKPTYIPEKEENFIKYQKLGIAYDFAPENETLKPTQSRKKTSEKLKLVKRSIG